jgi:preprotein translocase subunit SecB
MTLAANETNVQKINPERYREILSKTDLVDIRLDSCSVSFSKENLALSEGLEVSIKDQATFSSQGRNVDVVHKFRLVARNPGSKKKEVVRIAAAFCLTYATEHPFDDGFFEVFKEISLPLNSWPYFREFVQSMTQRIGIPPLVLPLIKRA